MQRLGWIAGRNLIVDYRYGLSDPQLHQANAKALVEARVDLVIAVGDLPTEAAFQATKTIPIVMAANAAVEFGYAKSLSRPGGNLTGVIFQSRESLVKPMEMLKAMRPSLSRLGVPVSLDSKPNTWVGMSAAANALGITAVRLPEVREISGVEAMLVVAKSESVQAIVVPTLPILLGEGTRRIQAWATEQKVLTWAGNWQRGELLLTFGPNFSSMRESIRRQADLVLRGRHPADIPIEEPSRFDILISLKIAKAMNLTIPQSVLLQATELIE